jgi:hypothetical protein
MLLVLTVPHPHHSKYKFHRAFENSLRPDFFTEKVAETALANTLPVSYGPVGAADFYPGGEGSYLEALQFSSPRELAKKMLELDADDEKYLEYFNWRLKDELPEIFIKQEDYNTINKGKNSWVCRMCQVYMRRYCHRDDV